MSNVERLVEAMAQLLDDMGRNGLTVCLAAKAQARLAYEPFRDKGEPDDWTISTDESVAILKEAD